MTERIFSAYGRAWRMRSWARRILLVATICIALVIFCVLFTLAIFWRISFVPGIGLFPSGDRVLDELFAEGLQRGFVLLERRIRVDGIDGRLVAALGEGVQRGFHRHHLLAVDLVEVAVVHRVDGQRDL